MQEHAASREKERKRREAEQGQREELDRYNRQIAEEYSAKKEKDMAALRADMRQQIEEKRARDEKER